MSFTMTLAYVTHQDTGYFQFVIGDMEIKQYVYVFASFLNFKKKNEMTISMFCFISDEKNLVFMSDKSFFPNYYLFFFHQGELGVHIPCKPTHPNVTVSLIQIEQLNKEPNFEVFKSKILSAKVI